MTRSEGAARPPAGTTVEEILDELTPLMRDERRQMARQWCFGGVSTSNLHVLMVLETEGSLPMGRVAEVLDVSMPNATGIVDRMEERGLVERTRDPDDRRLVLVRLADRGRRAVEQIEEVRREHLARILAAMEPRERETCLRAFRLLRRTAERLRAETPAAPTERRRPPAASADPAPQARP